MDFKAEKIGDEIIVKAITVKDGDNITVHVPSFQVINELKKNLENGERDLQQI